MIVKLKDLAVYTIFYFNGQKFRRGFTIQGDTYHCERFLGGQWQDSALNVRINVNEDVEVQSNYTPENKTSKKANSRAVTKKKKMLRLWSRKLKQPINKMKTIIKLPILLCALFISLTSFAQDVIIDNEGETIDCTVLAVNQTAIVYRQGEKAVSLPKSKAMMIYYGNGKQEVFNKKEQPAKPETATIATVKAPEQKTNVAPDSKAIPAAVIPATDTITSKKGDYYLGDRKIKNKELFKLINDSNCEEAKAMLKKRKGANFVTAMGFVIQGAALGYGALSLADGDDSGLLAGAAGMAAGTTFVIIGASSKKNKIRKAVELYNQCVRK